ncbi:Vacuolar fusion protein MON1 [Leucoagaricus sp. SymC.cos]|nr:Vacuolar fusion protein MON1 [Leucoagaricus sp. SymC.cos]
MSHTPRSRTHSRPSQPGAGVPIASPGSRLVVPPLNPSPSLSNLHIHSHGANAPDESDSSSSAVPRDQALESSASSVINLDLNEGILIQDMDTGTDMAEEDSIEVQQPMTTINEESKRFLREQLRKTLSIKQAQEHDTPISKFRQPQFDLQEFSFTVAARFPPREYFVLTDAGKPVFISRPGNPNPDNMASTIGIMQALISIFIDDGDKMRCINAGQTRITFLLRPPLYYVCVSSWGEPESVSRTHLEYLHLQIISIVTASQLRRIFERRTNFDLRRFLDGAESFLTSLLDELEFDIAIGTSSLNCLKLESSLRKKIAESLVPTGKTKELLYIMLMAGGRVVTLIRPRKHSIHPADIHILLNTIKSPSISNSQASASWIPVCLPKFNPSGFVNAYISFLLREYPVSELSSPSSSASSTTSEENDADMHDPNITLICISSTGDFDHVKTWCETATKKLVADGLLRALIKAIMARHSIYTVAEVGVPGLRHFLYKSRPQVQITFPIFEDPYNNAHEKRSFSLRLITLYQTLHDSIHAKSGQSEPLKLQFIRTDTESVMGWITQPFELYIAVSPRLPKSAVIGAANAVVRWVKKEEPRLFLRDAPIF